MVQKWIKCCSDASVCCSQHLKDDSLTHAPDGETDRLSNPSLNPGDQRFLGPKDISENNNLKTRTSSHLDPGSWDGRIVGQEEVTATPGSVIRSADGSDVHHVSAPLSSSPGDEGRVLRCPRTWDGWSCWKEDVAIGVTVEQPCPDHIYWKITAPPCRGQ